MADLTFILRPFWLGVDLTGADLTRSRIRYLFPKNRVTSMVPLWIYTVNFNFGDLHMEDTKFKLSTSIDHCVVCPSIYVFWLPFVIFNPLSSSSSPSLEPTSERYSWFLIFWFGAFNFHIKNPLRFASICHNVVNLLWSS